MATSVSTTLRATHGERKVPAVRSTCSCGRQSNEEKGEKKKKRQHGYLALLQDVSLHFLLHQDYPLTLFFFFLFSFVFPLTDSKQPANNEKISLYSNDSVTIKSIMPWVGTRDSFCANLWHKSQIASTRAMRYFSQPFAL